MENQQQSQVMSVKEWITTIIIASIPLVGFIMLFIWAFGSNSNTNRSNWAKASLIWMCILLFIYFIFMMMFGTAAFLMNR